MHKACNCDQNNSVYTTKESRGSIVFGYYLAVHSNLAHAAFFKYLQICQLQGALQPLVTLIETTMVETGNALEATGHKSLGQFIIELVTDLHKQK